MASSSPGPGTYGRKHDLAIGEPIPASSPGALSWDAQGAWEWKEVRTSEGMHYTRVHCANQSRMKAQADASPSIGPGSYSEVSPAVYQRGVPRNFSQAEADSSFATEGRQAISDRRHGSVPGPGEYSGAYDSPSHEGTSSGAVSAFVSESRGALSERHDTHHGSAPGPGDYASTRHGYDKDGSSGGSRCSPTTISTHFDAQECF